MTATVVRLIEARPSVTVELLAEGEHSLTLHDCGPIPVREEELVEHAIGASSAGCRPRDQIVAWHRPPRDAMRDEPGQSASDQRLAQRLAQVETRSRTDERFPYVLDGCVRGHPLKAVGGNDVEHTSAEELTQVAEKNQIEDRGGVRRRAVWTARSAQRVEHDLPEDGVLPEDEFR